MSYQIKLAVGYIPVYFNVDSPKEGIEYQKTLPCSSTLYENDQPINTVTVPYSPRSVVNTARYLYMGHRPQLGAVSYSPVDDEMYKWYSSVLSAMDKYKFVILIGPPDVANNDLLEVIDIFFRIKNKYTDNKTPGLWTPNYHEIIEEFKKQKDLKPEARIDVLKHYSVSKDYAYHLGVHNIYATDDNFYCPNKKTYNILQEIINRRLVTNNCATIFSTNEGIASFNIMLRKENFNSLLDNSFIRYIDRPKDKL